METSTKNFSELNVRKLTIRIVLAFIAGVSAVLITTFFVHRQVQHVAEINTQIDEILNTCRKQRTLSQYLTKNALILESNSKQHDLTIQLLDSSLAMFHQNHIEIEAANLLMATYDIDISKVDSLYHQVTPAISALIRSSYGIQEAANVSLFRSSILKHEDTFLPAMNSLIDGYQSLSKSTNERLSDSIATQYLMIGGSVILAASLVLIFTIQLVQVRILRQRKHFKEVLLSKERYEQVVNGTHDIIYELNADGEYIYINPAFESFIGYSLSEINSKNWFDNVVPSHRAKVVEFYTRVRQEEIKESYLEFPIMTANDEVKWIGQSADFDFGENGWVKHIYCVAKDITELKSSNSKEEKYKKGLKLLNELNTTPEMNVQQRIEHGLKLCLDYLGLDQGIVSTIWMDEYRISAFYPLSDELEINQKFKLGDTYCDITLAQQGKVLSIDQMSDSSHKSHPCFENFNLESYIGAAYRMDGKITGTVNFTSSKPRKEPFSDYEIDFVSMVARWVGGLMEQRENASKIQEEQNLLKTFISSAPAAIAMLDKHMNYISASERWYKDQNIVGDIIGKSHYKIFPEVDAEWKKNHQRALDGEIVKPGIQKFVRANGEEQWLQGEIHPWYTSKDKVGGIIIFSNDLTELKRQEVELRYAKEEAEDASRIKEQFLSTMSHEIRTPLNAIIGTTNLLEMEHPELEGSARLQMLKFGSNNLLTLINDILDFQKIESGNLEIVNEDVNLHKLLGNIIETWKPVSQDGNVKLKHHYANALADYYVFDGTRLTQVLNNLLSNALKFTEKGEVELDVQPGGDGVIQFTIRDTGIGIPSDKLEIIFDSFKQVNNSYTTKVGGTGLGLSISKRLVDLMGGKLEVVSEEGKGTTFYFSVAFGISETKSERKKKAKNVKSQLDLHVLLVEDNRANQEIAKGFLTRWGISVDLANNGEEAVEKIVSKAYDLMIIDVRMPVMDGYEATRQIRAMNDEYFKKLPIIALTASTLLESRSKMERSGMNEIVSKPFDPEDLFEKVSRLGKKSLRKLLAKKSTDVSVTTKNVPFGFLHELLGGDEEKVLMIVDMAVKSISEGVTGAREMMIKEDREKAYDHLHKMKSNLANIDLRDLASRMPDYRSDDFWKRLPDFLDRVEEEIDKINQELVAS
ncbi:ATP-binding protein [Ekhidna sp. To15]|uniref:ATP-binding protein n=1 Tax=Ekhidna sp. To15 TaxID=3395267 RepID=UPI003F522C5A